MKNKVSPIAQQQQPATLNPGALTESESRILKHLVGLLNEAHMDVSQYVGQVLMARQLAPQEWSISLADCKTITKIPQEKAQDLPPEAPTK